MKNAAGRKGNGTMNAKKIIYLDNAATTPAAPEAAAAMQPYFSDLFGNPATLYRTGTTAARAVDTAREQLAALLGADPEEIFFTSGGTESNNWILKVLAWHGDKKHLITDAIEHHAVLETVHYLEKHFGCPATILPVDRHGLVSAERLREALRPDTALVSIMHANNEIGSVEPIAELAAIAHEKGALFHTDAVQSVGKIPINVRELGVDALSLSAHKFHGPKGVGALFVKRGIGLPPFHHGGGQERGRRAGTTNVAGVVGMGVAADLARKHLAETGTREWRLVERLWEGLSASIPGLLRNGHPQKRIPNLLSICVSGIEGEALLLDLDRRGIQVSSGSACTTGNPEPSHVLKALGLPPEIARGSLRLSLSRYTTAEEIEEVIQILPGVVERLRALSPLWKNAANQ